MFRHSRNLIDEKDYGGNPIQSYLSNLCMYQLRLARLCLALAFTSCQPPAAEAFDPAQQ